MVSLLARLGLAAVWLVSGWLKVIDPAQTRIAVEAYRLLPDGMVDTVAVVLPFLEIGLGLLLLIGLGVRITAVASGVLLLVLIAAIVSAWTRGLSIDCGCFGGGGAADVDSWDYLREIARDVGFLALAAWLMTFPRTLLSLGLRSRPGLSDSTQPNLAE